MTRRGQTGGVKRVAFRRPCSRPVLGTKFSPDAVRVASRASTPSSTRDAPAESPAPASATTVYHHCWDLSARRHKRRPQGPQGPPRKLFLVSA